MHIRDVMTRDVMVVRTDTPVKEAAGLLLQYRVSGAPVVDESGNLVGVVSELDFVRPTESSAGRRRPKRLSSASGISPGISIVAQVMRSPAITIEAGAPLRDAASLMLTHGIKRLPVLEGNRLVGIVTRADLLRAFVRSDETIRDAVRDEVLGRAMWLDPDAFDVTVADGLVSLGGSVDRRSTAEIIAALVARVEGVTGVSSSVSWEIDDRDLGRVEPMIDATRSAD
jgi:Predicted signal-transduction protein containing cAMP-binding and CBS domains